MELIQYIPVAVYEHFSDRYSLWTGPHGPRTYATLPSALQWRERHGMVDGWKILKLTIRWGEEPIAEWVA
ncbi:hypothetical protein ASE48_08725 [Mycobacterium sp. Root265]|uniref:hypothetical protein n=1 Tax=Mycobacterium sp. Root265 TaxID=1736504 RepID=UPI00070EEDE9|nr:hypothetical protein [Mycobacterium sp. Root265]KRD08634.1 hypothetical protein ASE48_08725 [Mycobacterium sp. Root265]